MEQANREALVAGLAQYGVKATDPMVDALGAHLAMVVDWNERVNLTAIRDEHEMVLKHAVDSVTALSSIDLTPGMKVLDVGTGAGFPGVVLKCVQPGIKLSLLESLNKRCTFLKAVGEEVISKLDRAPGGYEVIWGRAEDFGRDIAHRQQYDLVVARAVAELRVLSEYCLAFCRVGGTFLAMKGPAAGEEIAAAEKAITILGGEVAEAREIELPEGAGARTLIRIKKVKNTPAAYPRKAGTPSKTPL